MGGTNPYVAETRVEPPSRRYSISFRSGPAPEDEIERVEVDPAEVPYGRTGLPGSVLDVALARGIEIDHACGGVVACSTCHVIVRAGFDTCNEASEDEEDMLDNAPGLEPESRLSCQCVANGSEDLVVEIPEWNRNMVKEAPH